MKLGIVGCLHFMDYDVLCGEVSNFIREGDPLAAIVSGGARGADTLARRYAAEHGLEMIEHLPEWARFGKAAGPIRNHLIVEDADAVIAFFDGKDRGTKSTIDTANGSGTKLVIIRIEWT